MVTLYQASGATRTQRWLGKHGATDVVGPLEARGHFRMWACPLYRVVGVAHGADLLRKKAISWTRRYSADANVPPAGGSGHAARRSTLEIRPT
jgi:hypothetical protein